MITLLTNRYRQGIRKAGTMISLIAAASGVAAYSKTLGRTCVVRRVHIYNNNAAPTIVSLGSGLLGAFAASIPGWYVVNGMDRIVLEEELPEFEWTDTLLGVTGVITAAASAAAAAPNNIQVLIEAEEYQGPTG